MRRVPVLAAAATALLVPSFVMAVPAAHASPSGGGTSSSRPVAAHQAPEPPARPGTGKQASAVAAALKLAKSSGRAVSTGSSSSANPDGTFTVTAPASSKHGTYRVKVPSQLHGATVKSASVAAAVACSSPVKLALSVTSPGGASLGGGSMWNSSSRASCGSPAVSLPLTGAVRRAVSGRWQTLAFRLSGAKASSPKLDVTYTEPPSAPSALSVSSGSLRNAGCAGSSSPAVVPGQAATMQAGVYDSVGAPEAARFTYWVKGSSKKTTVTSAPALSGQNATAIIPASVTRNLGKNTVVDWTAAAVDSSGSAVSSPSAACAVTVDAAAEQSAPAISGGPSTDPVPGTEETWTVTAAAASQSGVTPTAVVWDLDQPPPVSDPDSHQVISIASGSTSAQVSADVPSPGPHAFYAYVEYSDGSVSSTATSAFTADNDPAVSCATFAGALAGTGCVNPDGSAATSAHANQMISNGADNASGTAGADGPGGSYTASQLTAAGWKPGGTVAVDGATFTLPQYGTSSSGNDNLLAAGQTIGLPASLSSGSSLVFLVAGTDEDMIAPAASDLPGPVSPPVPQGTRLVGQDCDRYQYGQAGSRCTPAPAGTVNYVDANGNASSQDYDLEAPDWSYMTPSISAVTMPDRSAVGGLDTSQTASVYAVSIPLDPAKTIASVTLPDVGEAVKDAAGTSWPALHVLGVAVANTSSSTPGTLAGIPSVDAGDLWTGSWESPVEAPHAPYTGTSYSNQTVRIVTTASAGGFGVRLRLSDAVADAGSAPLSVGAVTVAQQSSGAAVSGTPVPVTFGGSKTVTIPEGGDVYSDPVLLPTASGGSPTVTDGEHLTVSISLAGSYPSLPTRTLCSSACTEYVSASGSGDKTADTSGASFTGTGTVSGAFSTVLVPHQPTFAL